MISVIMPTYNRGYKIKSSIESILKQTFTNFELIIVDDASTDNTEQIIASFKDNRIRYIRHTENKGAAAARNTGWKAAKYDFLTFLDSDDLWFNNYLDSQYKIFKQRNKLDGIQICKYRVIKNNDVVLLPNHHNNITSNDTVTILLKMIKSPFITPQIIFMPKRIMEELGGFDEKLCAIEDFELGLRIANKYKIYENNEILVEIKISEDSLSLMHEKIIRSAHLVYELDYEIFNQDKSLKINYNYSVLLNYFRYTQKIDKKALTNIIRINPFSILIFKFFMHYFLFVLQPSTK